MILSVCAGQGRTRLAACSNSSSTSRLSSIPSPGRAGSASWPSTSTSSSVTSSRRSARLRDLLGDVLEERHVGSDRGQVRGRRDGDPGLPAVGHDHPAPLGGQVAHPPGLGETAHAAHVGLGDLHTAAVHQVEELKPGREPLAGGDRNRRSARQLGVALQVVCPQRRLDEEHVPGPPSSRSPPGHASTVFQAYATSTMIAKSGPTASRTPAIVSIMRSSRRNPGRSARTAR